MKIASINAGQYNSQLSFQKRNDKKGVHDKNINVSPKKAKLKRILPWAIVGGISAIGIGASYLAGVKKGKMTDKKANEVMLSALLALAGYSGIKASDSSSVTNAVDDIQNGKSPTQQRINEQSGAISEIKKNHTNPTINKYTTEYNGILLLKQDNVLNRNVQKYVKALDTIEQAGKKRLQKPTEIKPIDKKNPTIWSVTSEFAPIKEGGLGSVPPEIRNNAEKLGVNIPTFIPMYLNDGSTTLYKNGDDYTYTHKGKEIKLDKVATIKMDTYKDGKSSSIPVTYYLNTDKDKEGNERQLIFIQADDYFDGTIYEGNNKTEEPEKFAIMSKAVYELAKIKMDGKNANKNLEVHSDSMLNAIKEPDAMILNDWQASPVASLLRYKAPMENAHSQITDSTSQKLQDMRVIAIGHNAMYQGSTQNNNDYYQKKSSTQNILNTLFDKYAYDVVSHAKTGFDEENEEDNGLKKLDNVLVMNRSDNGENYTNFLNMGIILSDYFNPVSQNYAKELISDDHKELSRELQHALVKKNEANRLIGIINGNDFDHLSVEANKGQIKVSTGVDFETYKQTAPIEEVMDKRLKNKINLYNNYILPFAEAENQTEEDIAKVRKNISPNIEFVAGKQGTNLPILSDEELKDTPILLSGGRLVSQKGMEILCGAMEKLYNNWEEEFKDENKPILYIGGQDAEGGVQRKIIEDLKDNKLSKEDNDRILFAHGRVPMPAMMAGSDFFLMPSKFEPCGLTQGEAFAKGTPVIASAVGGIVDTVNRDGKKNGYLTEVKEPLTVDGFYEALKDGLHTFYDKKDNYSNMVRDSLDEDFSWIKSGKEGPVYDYLELLGIKKENLPDTK